MKTILTETKSFTFCSHSFIQSLICLFFFPFFLFSFQHSLSLSDGHLFNQSFTLIRSFHSFILLLIHPFFHALIYALFPLFTHLFTLFLFQKSLSGILTTMKFALVTLVALLSITWVSSSFLRSKLKLDDFKDEEPWVTFLHYYLFGRVSFFEHLLFHLFPFICRLDVIKISFLSRTSP